VADRTTGRWAPGLIGLHWIMVLVILMTMALGWVAEEYPNSPDKVRLFVWHKSFGITVLFLLAFRLASRLRHGSPSVAASITVFERRAARFVQLMLYLLMAVMPISGWVINSAADFPLHLFGVIPWPALVGPNEELKEIAEAVHKSALWLLLALLLLHAGAALRHHFLLRDDVLRGMLPGGRP